MLKEMLMKKAVLFAILTVVILPVYSSAQQGGALVGSFGIGLTAAQGDFASTDFLAAGSGFGAEVQIRYYPINGFGLGPMANYMRFGSSYQSENGRVSYNFSQVGGVARLNLIPFSSGSIFVNGGGGIFTPNAHYYEPDNPVDQSADESGTFFFGGLGLSSFTDRKVTYEFEVRFSSGRTDLELDNGITSDAFDFVYVGMRLSFASKGKESPPRY
jgi:hypothetical protein